ncbi:MAG: ABC transporter permease [Niastella sp.]|nr:ABC transporter permease [Niastella sp.]
MIRNYFKTAIRSLLRNKGYAAINITGLTVGIAACLLIYLIVSYHTSFDNYHTKKDRIYRAVSGRVTNGVEEIFTAGVPFPVTRGLREDFPELSKVASILRSGNDQITVLDEHNQPAQKYKEVQGLFFTEPELFDIFDYKWLAGDPKKSLSDPNSVVLTQEMAEKYFGNWQVAMGRSIKLENTDLLKVTGILANMPSNTDIPIRIAVSWKTFKSSNLNDWISIFGSHSCFVLLPENYPASRLSALMPGFVKKHKPAENAEDAIILQPLSELHFNTKIGAPSRQTFSRELITALSLVGLFLLIIACVNFINLATAQAVNRAKEVGVRKVLGSNRSNLIFQFMGETLIITLVAVLLATAVAWMALPPLNTLLQTNIHLNIFAQPIVVLFLLAVTLLVTLLAGFYPALVLSGYNPITALRSKVAMKTAGGLSLRRTLVVFQFAIAQVLIIGMLVVVGQMNYFKNASLGFNKDYMLNVPIPGDSAGRAKIDFLRSQLLQQPGIEQLSFSNSSPSESGNWSSDFKYGNTDKKSGFEAILKWSDEQYFKTYNIEFVAGRPYMRSDTIREFVVNETLLKRINITNPEEAIGMRINLWDGEHIATICGVVKDFHARALRVPLDPVIMGPWKENYQSFNVKLRPDKAKETLAYVEKLWTSTYPDFVYEYQFLDDKIDRFYRQETQLSRLYTIFAAIAIFISCLGLYGLVSFMATQRVKEVGIRKVLGASVGNIVYLFSREFTLLIIISFAIAGPLAWYLMTQWLQDFEYRIKLGVGIFLLAITSSIVIAWITVGYRAIRAALVNPVKSLKSE